MLRVCHISTVHPTFDQRIFHRECWSLQQAGYETHLIVQHDDEQTLVDGIHIHGVDHFRKSKPGMHLLRRLRRLWRALRLASRLDADIYHLHDPELILVGLWLKLRGHGIVIFDCHENNVAYIKQKHFLPGVVRALLVPLMALIERLAARYFDAIITADSGVADIYRLHYGAQLVQVIHNFPRLDLFLDTESTATATPKTVDLVYHGSIPRYHLTVAFNVARELKARGYHVTWLFFGSGVSAEWVEAELEGYGLKDVFTYDPNRIPHEQVADRVRQARIGFIPLPDLPKFQHNIPTKLFEYMALQMPIVLSDLPPSRPFVGDGQAAFMVHPSDYDAYADAIQHLLEDDTLRQRMGQVGYERVTMTYNWDAESKHLIHLYQALQDA